MPYRRRSFACTTLLRARKNSVRRHRAASPLTIMPDQLGFFRWGRIAERVLVTTDGGDWAFLSESEFAQLLAGEITQGHPRFAALQAGGFLREGLDVDALASRLGRHVRHVANGPERHVVTV